MARKRWPLVVIGVAVAAAIALYAKSLFDERWLPPGPPEVAGRILMERKRCVRCHLIAGAGGFAGPELTLVARRKDEASLRAYLDDPRAVDPNARMPRPSLTPEQRAAVIVYLMTLDGSGIAPTITP